MAEAQGCDGSTVVGLQLRKNCSGERGPDEPERGRAHRRVSRVADGEAELTVARDGARTRRWRAVAELAAHVGRARERARGFG
jgi:hypothetical protein